MAAYDKAVPGETAQPLPYNHRHTYCPAPVPVSYAVQYTWFGTQNKVLRIFVALFIFLCYLITFFSYFKVY